MLAFEKYHGLGNDFIVIDRLAGGVPLAADAVVRVCHRHRGIGADGVLTLWPDASADGRMQVQNADGSESDMCGNGLRCLARYLYDAGIVPASRPHVTLRAGAHVYTCERMAADVFRVGMGSPVWQHDDLPRQDTPGALVELSAGARAFAGTAVFLGNPHWVTFVEDAASADALRAMAAHYGPALERHAAFAQRANISFVRPHAAGFQAVVFERGVGITQACGSGACAVAMAAVRRGMRRHGESIPVELPGGTLHIEIVRHAEGPDHIFMQGQACWVYRGQWDPAGRAGEERP